LDLEIALGGFPAPNVFGVEASGDVIEVFLVIRKNDVELYFTYFAWYDIRQSLSRRSITVGIMRRSSPFAKTSAYACYGVTSRRDK